MSVPVSGRPAPPRPGASLRTRLLRGLLALSLVAFALAVTLAVANTRHNVRAELASSAEAKKAEWESKQFTPRGGGGGHSRDAHAPRKPHRGQGASSSGDRGGASRNADFPVMRSSGDEHGSSRNATRPARGWSKPRGRR